MSTRNVATGPKEPTARTAYWTRYMAERRDRDRALSWLSRPMPQYQRPAYPGAPLRRIIDPDANLNRKCA